MIFWHLEYFAIGVLCMILAHNFYKTKDGMLRKSLISLFASMAWRNIILAIAGCLEETWNVDINYDTIRIIAAAPVLISIIFLLTYVRFGIKMDSLNKK